MPTYDYECPRGHRFERFHSITAKPIAACPRCKRKAKRLLSAGAGLLFKGRGFYTTDYRSSSYQKGAQSDKTGSASSTEKPDSSEKPPLPKKSGP